MNKIKFGFISFSILICTIANGQQDTTWNKSLTARYSQEIVPSTANPYRVKSFEVKLKKGNHTLLPMVSHKSIYDLSGYQFGIAYYKKWKWGYSHGGVSYSSDIVFPTLMIKTNVYFTLKYGLEANCGFHNITYADGNKVSFLNLGMTYYYRSLMSSYTIKMPFSGYVFHNFIFRKYLNSDKDHLQLSISNGIEQEALLIGTFEPLKVYGFQFSISKTIIKKIQVQFAFGLSKATNESTDNQFFNYGIGLKRDI